MKGLHNEEVRDGVERRLKPWHGKPWMSDEKSILYLNLIMWAKCLPHGTQSVCAPFPFLPLYSVGSREPLVVSKWGREVIRLTRRTWGRWGQSSEGLSRKVTAETGRNTWPGQIGYSHEHSVMRDDEESRELFIVKIPEAANTGTLLEQDSVKRQEDSLGCSNIDFPAGYPGKEREAAVAWGRRLQRLTLRSHPQGRWNALRLWSNAASLGVFPKAMRVPRTKSWPWKRIIDKEIAKATPWANAMGKGRIQYRLT